MKHLRAGVVVGVLVLVWQLLSLVLDAGGLMAHSVHWAVKLRQAVLWTVAWMAGVTAYSVLAPRFRGRGMRGWPGAAALAGVSGVLGFTAAAGVAVAIGVGRLDGMHAPLGLAIALPFGALTGVFVVWVLRGFRRSAAPGRAA